MQEQLQQIGMVSGVMQKSLFVQNVHQSPRNEGLQECG